MEIVFIIHSLNWEGVGTTTDASTLTPVELRARNIVELVLNVDAYRAQYNNVSAILDEFENYVRFEMVRDTNYVGIWDLLRYTNRIKYPSD